MLLLRAVAFLCAVARVEAFAPRRLSLSPIRGAAVRSSPETEDAAVEEAAAPKAFDARTLSYRDKVSNYNRPDDDSGLLSERWKEAEGADAAADGGGGGFGGALKAVALVVALAAFSQVPLGDPSVSIPANDPTRVPVTNFVKILDDP